MRRPNWRPFALIGLMVVVMFGLMTMFSSMLGGMTPMAPSSTGLRMWGVMVLPIVGLLVMGVIMFFLYRSMTGGGGLMSTMMGRRNTPRSQGEGDNLTTLTFTLPAVNCDHCKMRIEQAVGDLPGVAFVNVDVDTNQAIIRLVSPPTRAEIAAVLTEIGYPPESE